MNVMLFNRTTSFAIVLLYLLNATSYALDDRRGTPASLQKFPWFNKSLAQINVRETLRSQGALQAITDVSLLPSEWFTCLSEEVIRKALVKKTTRFGFTELYNCVALSACEIAMSVRNMTQKERAPIIDFVFKERIAADAEYFFTKKKIKDLGPTGTEQMMAAHLTKGFFKTLSEWLGGMSSYLADSKHDHQLRLSPRSASRTSPRPSSVLSTPTHASRLLSSHLPASPHTPGSPRSHRRHRSKRLSRQLLPEAQVRTRSNTTPD